MKLNIKEKEIIKFLNNVDSDVSIVGNMWEILKLKDYLEEEVVFEEYDIEELLNHKIGILTMIEIDSRTIWIVEPYIEGIALGMERIYIDKNISNCIQLEDMESKEINILPLECIMECDL